MEPSMPSPTFPGMQSPQTPEPSKNMLPLILGAIVIVVVLIVAVFMMKGSSQKSPESIKPGDQDAVTKAPVKQDKMYAFPQVSVSDWVVPATVSVQAPTTAKLYQFKQNITAADFRQIADPFFQVDTLDEKPKRIVAYSTQAGASMFYLQKATGSFLFSADKGIPVTASTSAGITAMTRSMMKDPSLELLGEYDKSNEAGVHYYEFHRSWETMGLPVLNLFGLFNAPSSVALKSLTLATTAGRSSNPVYVNTTDNSNGLDRPNDFNSVTVGVKGGKITSVVSNLRPFAAAGGSSPVMTYAQAVAKLKANGYSHIYTSPEGEGTVDHDKMYPQNKAELTSATVDDATIAYLEELPKNAQKQMVPYYLFKGTGSLKSGYKVRFIAAVTAVTSGVLGVSTTNTALLAQNGLTGVPVGNSSSQQQGTLQFEEHGGMLPGSSPVANSLPTLSGCKPPPAPQDLTDVQQDPSGIVFGRAKRDGHGSVEWYVVPAADWDVEKLKDAVNVVWNSVTNSATESDEEKVRRIQKVVEDFEEQSAGCPVRVTGSSPTLFIHSDVSQTLTVSPGSVITYADPTITASGWSVQVTGDSIQSAGHATDYLYYEYVPVTFARPQTGWNVQKSQLGELAKTIARALGLTTVEASRLVFELNHASSDVAGEDLFVGLVSKEELASKLPLSVQSAGKIDVQRIQFTVTSGTGRQVSTPVVTPVQRSPFYLLEIGATAQ